MPGGVLDRSEEVLVVFDGELVSLVIAVGDRDRPADEEDLAKEAL